MRAMQFPAGPSVRLCGRACHLRHCSSSPPFRIRKWTFPRSGWNITRSCPVTTAPGTRCIGRILHTRQLRSSWRIRILLFGVSSLIVPPRAEKPTSTRAKEPRAFCVRRLNLSCYRGYKYTSHCALGRSNSVQNASLAVPQTFRAPVERLDRWYSKVERAGRYLSFSRGNGWWTLIDPCNDFACVWARVNERIELRCSLLAEFMDGLWAECIKQFCTIRWKYNWIVLRNCIELIRCNEIFKNSCTILLIDSFFSFYSLYCNWIKSQN